MNWYEIQVEPILKKLDVDPEQGLSQSRADSLLEEYGPNEFDEEKKETLLARILHHLREISTIILIIAACIAAYMAISTGTGWPKVFVILSIVIINVILGITQESKAQKALEALMSINAHHCTVIRNGSLMHIPASDLVIGDIIELHAGDMIPADARLIRGNSLQVEESALTGESVPVEKDADVTIPEDAPLGDRINMVYSGCLVTNGRAKAVVCATGMQTEMGKIAGLLNDTTKLLTPLQIRLKGLAKRISLVAIGAGLVIFGVGYFINGESLPEMLLIAVALAVAAVPETLPVIVSLIHANGVQNMVKKNAIVRNIPAVETIGNTSVICSDKTGTLTINKMIIRKIWQVDNEPNNSGHEFTEDEQDMLELISACTNATPKECEDPIHEDVEIIGDPTEAAIVMLLIDKGFCKSYIEEKYPRVYEFPFDSTRKLMTTVHKTETGYISVTKGAFDRIPVNFSDKELARATEVHDGFADEALRVIAVAVKEWDELPEDMNEETFEKDLTFLGMVGMIDPPRPESRRAVMQARKAGIRTVMITGDHVKTAAAIARDIGILEEGGRAVSGIELSHMSDEELNDQIRDISVYARVSPEDKIRIVQAWQAHNEVIAMTGDGVNDAPALKYADVGAAMGITGTDVSKNASDIIITDDNFATIVDAIKEGRTSYDNIRKTVHFLLSVNFAEILIMLIGVLIGWGTPLTSVQLLFINVVSDGIPGFFISREKSEKDLMERKPLSKNAGIFAAGLGKLIAGKSAIFILLTLTAFYIGNFVEISESIAPGYGTGITMAFVVLSWASILNIFNVRSKEFIFKSNIMSNRWLLGSVILSATITAVVTLVVPLQGLFGLSPLSINHWLIAIALAVLQLVFGQIVGLFLKR